MKYLCSILLMLLTVLGYSIAQGLNPGDGVRITLYNVSDPVSGDYYILENGTLRLPYLGVINTTDLNFKSLKTEIEKNYNTLYKNAELTVKPLYRISIQGEVEQPSIYYVTGIESLTDVLALAGGETEEANIKKIYLIRNDRKTDINARKIFEKGSKISDLGLRSGDKLYVSKRGWLNWTNASIIASIGTATATLLVFMLR